MDAIRRARGGACGGRNRHGDDRVLEGGEADRPANDTSNVPFPAAAPSGATSAASGTVSGKVDASGTAVVVLEPKGERSFPPQAEKPVMDQVGLTFGPDLLIVRTGEPVEFRNSDDTLHNVNVKHEETREQAFNVAIRLAASTSTRSRGTGFTGSAATSIPAMAASIFSTGTPFATVAGSDGGFLFSDVPGRVDADGLHRGQTAAQGRRGERRRDRRHRRVIARSTRR